MSKLNVVSKAPELGNETGAKFLVGGSLVFVSLAATKHPPKGFVTARPREASRVFTDAFRRKAPKMYLYFHASLLDREKSRYAFAVDSYLAWGLQHSKKNRQLVLIGGVQNDYDYAQVDAFVFENSKLIDIQNFELPERSAASFEAAAEQRIQSLRTKYPKADLIQAGPMAPIKIDNCEYVGDMPFVSAQYQTLSRSISPVADYFAPAAIALAGFLSYAGAIGYGWSAYNNAVTQTDAEASDPAFKKEGGVNVNYIDVMNQRRLFMEAPRRQDLLPGQALKIVRGIGDVPKVQIRELKLPAPSSSTQAQFGLAVTNPTIGGDASTTVKREPDTAFTIAVPKSNQSAVDQARDVINIIGRRTGMDLRLMNQGWKDEGNMRVLTLEGFLHHG